MTRPLRILHLEDRPRDAELVRDRLETDGVACDIRLTNTKDSFEDALAQEHFDLIISDYNLPGYDGFAALKRAQVVQPDVPVILISGTVGEEEAVKCLQLGATDYLLKGRLDRLAPAVQRAMREADTRRTRMQAERALQEREHALRENEERTTFALTAARMGIWEVEFPSGRMSWSDSMAPLFGLTPAEAPRRTEGFFRLIHPNDRRVAEESVERAIAGEREYAVEFRAVWPNGSAHWLQVRARAVYDADGKPSRLLGVAMDIDERKVLEEQLRQSQKLEAVGQLAGGVAHDFNNVLTVILGFSELRLMELDVEDPARADLLEIKKAGTRAAGLTRQLLAFSRKQILQPAILDVNDLIVGIEPMLRLLIIENVELTLALDAREALITIDPTQVEQILVNLAVNASDAMANGGKMTIATSNVTLDEDYPQQQLPITPGEYVMLTVTDTGAGMSSDVSGRIFEPFFTTKEVGKGTGLGLATVYGIVKQSGGDISLRTSPGHGTTFSILLPLTPASAVVTLPREHAPPRHRREIIASPTETILLVEDDAGVGRLARVTLERLGYHVLQAENPKVAAQLAAEFTGPIHLLLSDVIMPESDGPPLLERLLELRPSIRALYMSGYADEAIRRVISIEGTPFLQKPFSPDTLADKVRRVLDDAPSALASLLPQAPALTREVAFRLDADRAANAMVTAHQVLRAVLDVIPSFVFAKDREGRFTVVNRSFAEAYGTTPEKMLGGTEAQTGAPAEKIAGWLARDREAMDTLSDVFVPEEVFIDVAGGEHWLQSHKRPIIDDDGVARQVLVVATDITARRAAQLASAQLAGIVNSSSEAIMSAGLDGLFTSWNPAAEALFGYTANEILGKHISLLNPNGSTSSRILIDLLKRGQLITEMEAERRRKDDSLVHVSLSMFPLRDLEGHITGVSAVARDVSELRRANAQLLQSEALLAEAQRVARVGSWWQEIDTGVVGWTDETSRQLGYTPGNVDYSFEGFMGRMHPDDRAHAQQVIRACLATGKDVAFRARYYVPSGQDGVFESRGRVEKDGTGRPVRLVGTIQDITAQVDSEHTLELRVADRTAELTVEKEMHRQARELAEAANLAKSEFLANMSHELRTPLNSVIGFADILLKNKGGHLAARELTQVDRIQANGRHLLVLINSVLDLSKVESGHLELEITPVSVADLVRETIAGLASQAGESKVRLFAECPLGECLIETDRARLRQILVNLVGNALKFSSERDVRIVLAVDPATGRPIRLDVIDTGIGIPEDRLESIFQAFRQADNTTSREFGGTGLGLTISRSLARLLGFEITVTSAVGSGSTFSIVFEPTELAGRPGERLGEAAILSAW
ncbi:MAG: PAS domain S-box protein [Gemmatimonadaceae bacterium]